MPHDPTRSQDPYRMALMELTAAHNTMVRDEWEAHLACAQVHATLAVARAIQDQTAFLGNHDLQTRIVTNGVAS